LAWHRCIARPYYSGEHVSIKEDPDSQYHLLQGSSAFLFLQTLGTGRFAVSGIGKADMYGFQHKQQKNQHN
jgi:hypothetical protein